ncbi:MAG: hypothetical protein ACREJC_00680, partial [Tepidisphaeraceae bacterium]
MPIIPLYSTTSHPDAWHQVRAPGGYEWWYFDAEDVERDRQVVAILFDGFVFHPGYLRRHFRFRRFPTKFAPAAPSEFVCAYFVVYHAGRIEHQFMTQYPVARFRASMTSPDVEVGPNRFLGSGNALHLELSGTPWELTWRGPRLLESAALSGDFAFTPTTNASPAKLEFFSQSLSGAEHHWVIANPVCDVAGTIRITGSDPIAFRGRGYHDHNYGTGPIGPGLKR